jgi:hypothetical protein
MGSLCSTKGAPIQALPASRQRTPRITVNEIARPDHEYFHALRLSVPQALADANSLAGKKFHGSITIFSPAISISR